MSENQKPTLGQILRSVLGAFLGIQSDAVRERDFSQGSPLAYILVGLGVVVSLVLGLLLVVYYVTPAVP